ncbi:UDP-N-acetylmuramoyl-L-alanyl-D-glutamate--2,6-diaminopimelate ligase [Microlunatus capsulatus]|uniref:UDP-N-acetylmuramoyl-L-alanyl-D-glutamate--2, 6-diaminopimelate ligase n=1 Tax=Microlunatus capsulatus TaxID=99117 RepID=UPI001AE9D293
MVRDAAGLGSVGAVSPVPTLRPRPGPPLPLLELAAGLRDPDLTATGAGDPDVTGVTLDSRQVQPGDLYVALPGRHHHGAAFTAAAAAAGAVAVLTDPAGRDDAAATGLPVLVTERPRPVMARAAAAVYGRPAERLTMHAVTGTNGKTTTTFLLDAALRAAGHHVGTVGTIGFLLDGQPLPASRTTITTPESPDLQALLAHLLEAGADTVAMEVSSHALVLGRADAITFDVAAFTNLGRDHLDFHGDEESYFAAKAQLFTPERTRQVVLSVDDDAGRRLLEQVRRTPELTLRTVSLSDPAADHRLLDARPAPGGGTAATVSVDGRRLELRLPLPGDFNVRNALTALAMVSLTGGDVEAAAAGLADVVVPGRMQPVPLGPGAPAVVVDFAHTPQAVAAALGALRDRRVVVVLGCGGDRDPQKRRPMGEAAARAAAVVVVTDDNPRSEDPAAIRAAVLAGARAAGGAEVHDGGDRAAAIALALELAGPDDVVAVLGKGHETGQEVAGTVLPFADADVVRAAWAARTATAGSPR